MGRSVIHTGVARILAEQKARGEPHVAEVTIPAFATAMEAPKPAKPKRKRK